VVPGSGYAKSKRDTEQLCIDWAKELGIGLGIGRLTQVFGTGDRTKKMIPSSIAAIRKGESVQLFGDGEDRRDYLFAHDAARLIADWSARQVGSTLNLATGISLSMNEILYWLAQVSGLDVKIQTHPRRKERRDFQFNIDRLIQVLGPQKFTRFPEALKATYESWT
jgi:nucleoside-diphosphate-sugar epimerase